MSLAFDIELDTCGTQDKGDPQDGQKRYSVMLETLLWKDSDHRDHRQ